MNNRDYWTLKAMKTYGGGFIKALAQAAYTADPENLSILREAFVKYWAQYEHMGRSLEQADTKLKQKLKA